MQEKKRDYKEMEPTLRSRVIFYFYKMALTAIISSAVAGLSLVLLHYGFGTVISTENFSDVLFAVAALYMIYCYALFKGDLSSKVDISNLEITSVKPGRLGRSRRMQDMYTRSTGILVSASYTMILLGLAYVAAIL